MQKHIRFDAEEALKVKIYAEENGISYNQAVRELISKSLEDNNDDLKMTKFLHNQEYIKKLLEQLYSDLEFENITNPDSSKSLNKFKSKHEKNMIND